MPLILLLWACKHPPEPDRPVPDSPQTSTTGDTSAATTADTSTPPIPIPDPLPPSVRIIGHPGEQLGTVGDLVPIPAYGTDPSAIFAPYRVDDSYAPPFLTIILPGALPNGDYDLYDVWDGISTLDGQSGGVVAGDVDDDGHLDLWYGRFLHRGPFLGRAIAGAQDAFANIEAGVGVGAYAALVANIDADSDGHEDVLIQDCCQMAWLHYGPFEGSIAGGRSEVPNPEITWFGDLSGCDESRGIWLLPDHLGPGRDAISVGIDQGPNCEIDTFVWELAQPRGTQLAFSERFGFADGLGTNSPITGAGDLDGDGFGEVIYGDWRGSWVLSGPLQGNAWYLTPVAFEQVFGHAYRAIGDLNGDGIQELLGAWEHDPYYIANSSWVILFSPYDSPLDWSTGLRLGHRWDLGDDMGAWVADLDGDGLPDITSNFEYRSFMDPPPPEELLEAGEIRIWYGRDILAAEQARTSLP